MDDQAIQQLGVVPLEPLGDQGVLGADCSARVSVAVLISFSETDDGRRKTLFSTRISSLRGKAHAVTLETKWNSQT